MRCPRTILLLSVTLFALGCATAPRFVRAKPLRVIDGDTLVVSVQGEKQWVRIANIDAPEANQPGGPEAKAALQRLLTGQLYIKNVGRSYHRTVAEVRSGGVNVAQALVRSGHAWGRSKRLKEAEAKACAEDIGIWSDADPTPPWQWR